MILLIDDDLDFCTFFKQWSEFSTSLKTDFLLKFSFEEKSQILESYSLVIIDLNLTDQKGLVLGQKIKNEFPLIKVIFISSLDGESIFEEGLIILHKCFASGSLTPLILQKEISLLDDNLAA